MGDFGRELKNFFKKGDMILLVMCLAISAFSCLVIASVTNAEKFGSSTRYILIQIGATGLGVLVYAIMSSIDLEFFSEHRLALTVFNIGLLLLLIPFGRSVSGNKSWLDFSFLPFDIVSPNPHTLPAEPLDSCRNSQTTPGPPELPRLQSHPRLLS